MRQAYGTCRFGHRALGRIYGGGILAFYPHPDPDPPWCIDSGGPIGQRGPVQAVLA